MGKHLGVAYNLRLPSDLKEKVSQSAKSLNRSMNADIVARLEESFDHKKMNQLEDVPIEELLAVVMKKLGKSEIKLELDDFKK